MAETAVPSRFLPAIAALAAGKSSGEAAIAAGVSDRTLRSWKSDPRFVRELDRVRIEACDQVMAAVVDAGAEALRALTDIQSDRMAPATARVAAAGHILRLIAGVRGENDLNAAMATVRRYGLAVIDHQALLDQRTEAITTDFDTPTALPWENPDEDGGDGD